METKVVQQALVINISTWHMTAWQTIINSKVARITRNYISTFQQHFLVPSCCHFDIFYLMNTIVRIWCLTRCILGWLSQISVTERGWILSAAIIRVIKLKKTVLKYGQIKCANTQILFGKYITKMAETVKLLDLATKAREDKKTIANDYLV